MYNAKMFFLNATPALLTSISPQELVIVRKERWISPMNDKPFTRQLIALKAKAERHGFQMLLRVVLKHSSISGAGTTPYISVIGGRWLFQPDSLVIRPLFRYSPWGLDMSPGIGQLDT